MSRWVFDIETNGLHQAVNRMYILAAWNLDTETMHYWLEGDLGWMDAFADATLLVGHNIIDYDLFVLLKLFGWKPPAGCTLHDTVVMSRVLNYRRFGDQGHGLEAWGQHLKFPKGDFHDWSQYSEEMKVYCLQDVRVNVVVYRELKAEFVEAIQKNPLIKLYMQCEHAVSRWCSIASAHGWPFDTEKALKLQKTLEAELEKITAELEHKLGFKAVAVDKNKGVVDVKSPKWVKDGRYHTHTAAWFGVDPFAGLEERPIAGPYCRVEIEPLKLSSNTDVKLFLTRNGWEPTEYNSTWDPEVGRKVQTSPKITEDSLEFLGGDGKLYMEYLTAVSRAGILKGFLENTDDKGMVHGYCKTIGTPSMRATHKVIVNIPSADARYGREMRELFGSMPGWTLVGCDSASNQARGLAHFLGDATFTDTLINGDIHTYNAQLLDKVLAGMGVSWNDFIIKTDKAQVKEEAWREHGSKAAYLATMCEGALKALAAVKRAAAKRILYAFLFGASGGKMWFYIFGTQNKEKGNKLKAGFTKAVPGFEKLIKKLDNLFGASKKYGEGWIPSLAGNRVYVDSFHKLLVYLLQSTEKITCSAACLLTMQRLEEAGIPFVPAVFMHDELDFLVPDEHALEAGKIGRQAFKDGPAMFGVEIMDGGEAKLGRNWYDVH